MIEIRGLKKAFDGRSVLDDLSCTMEAGGIYGLLGPNGAGKTTTINILCGLLDADGGEITIGGEPVSGSSRDRIGVVPQEISLYRDLTCRENLAFFARIYGLQSSDTDRRTNELIELFGLGTYRDTPVTVLSGGWQRRVNIAVALVHSPAVLVLDEPTSGLDVEARFELWELIHELRQQAVTILLTTHQLEEAERLCSRIGIIKNGAIVAEGSLDELRARVPASQIALVESEGEDRLRPAVEKLGWRHREYGNRLMLLLPEEMTLNELVNRFAGIPLTSVTLQDVRLEHVYLELTRG